MLLFFARTLLLYLDLQPFGSPVQFWHPSLLPLFPFCFCFSFLLSCFPHFSFSFSLSFLSPAFFSFPFPLSFLYLPPSPNILSLLPSILLALLYAYQLLTDCLLWASGHTRHWGTPWGGGSPSPAPSWGLCHTHRAQVKPTGILLSLKLPQARGNACEMGSV